MKTFGMIRKMFVIAGIVAVSAVASAYSVDATISIDRALNSPTLTVKYAGAKATLAELKLNGESVGTRTLSGDKDLGETNFTVTMSDLRDGDNSVEVILYDRTGKVVGTQKTNISTFNESNSPVYLSAPKMGASVRGPVEIKVGFGRELKNSYVSFFVNDEFKSMMNFPPYTYLWDTSKEPNGWHEVEAWVVDDTSTTFKTRKMRIFVNNPGGRTNRVGAPVAIQPRVNSVRAQVGSEAGLRSVATGAASAANAAISGAAPAVSGLPVRGPIKGSVVNAPSGTRANLQSVASASGPRFLTPSGTRAALPVALPVVAAKNATRAANAISAAAPAVSSLVPITVGQRIPNLASFAIVFNAQVVNFDVQPRVDAGVPMTPFRHLLEKAGAKVKWEGLSKTVNATGAGKDIRLQIGDSNAKLNSLDVKLELAPYIDRGRTIVPLSFVREALNVDVQFDKASGHVLITSKK